ncbi:AAA family ATPase [Agrobacterium vitis]|uniref:ATP-dependent nuclease n=1 Tax=Agrobacterium vitis TaxID=373 RepID=UPI0012E8AB49|nr:AAA family ATPase [Agrobacterium vitis]MVA70246.1 AAA family ATPase [Agrobacterium vitis]
MLDLKHEFAPLVLLHIQSEGRTTMANGTHMGKAGIPHSALATAYWNEEIGRQIVTLAHDAFGYHASLDIDRGNIAISFGRTPPPAPMSHRREQLDWVEKSRPFSQMSDGIKAFCGVALEVLAGQHAYLLLDEPDAYLHPPLAFKLGAMIAKHAISRQKTVLASTHSSQLVMGALQAARSVDIVRLSNDGDQITARKLDNHVLRHMMRNPLMRSANVMSSLFYDGVVICEDDTDRAFYQEVHARLVEAGEVALKSILFLNLNGKDRIHQLLAPLRQMGIPTAGIFDIDFLSSDTTKYTDTIISAGIDKDDQKFAKPRTNAWSAMKASSRAPKKDGLGLLKGAQLREAEELLERFSQYGIGIVPVGELECWLRDMGVTVSNGNKKEWLPQIFDRFGDDPSSGDYVKPSTGDVWEFVKHVVNWIADPNRLGMPQAGAPASNTV